MQLTVLGSNGTYPTAGRPASGYLLRTAQTNVWMEAGSGSFAALQEHIDPIDLDAVIISHVHADHCLDLLSYYHAARYGPRPRTGIRVLAADLVAERLGGFVGAGPDHGIWETFRFETVTGGDQASVGDMDLRFADTFHPVPTVATRVEARSRSLVYTGDTGWSDDVVNLARDADVLLSEAAYQGDEKPWPHHLTAAEAGMLASKAAVERLILTHISPMLDPQRSLIEAESTYGRQVRLAVPGVSISI